MTCKNCDSEMKETEFDEITGCHELTCSNKKCGTTATYMGHDNNYEWDAYNNYK